MKIINGINGSQKNSKTVESLHRLTRFESLKNKRSGTVSQQRAVSGRLGWDGHVELTNTKDLMLFHSKSFVLFHRRDH